MKDAKDYLHLYIGCEVTVPETMPPGKYIFAGFVTKNTLGSDHIFRLQLWNLLNEQIYWLDYDVCSLILRPLSSMTEEEKKELWRLVFSQGHGKQFNDSFKEFTGQIRIINETSYYQVPRQIMMQGVERLAIESDGTIWADCDLHNWRHNQHEVTKFLLSKGFDLFGLISEGLAIEKV